MKRFKDTMVAPGSQLWELMHKKASNPEEAKENKKAMEKLYSDTTEAYNKIHPVEVREYFAEKQREYFAKNKPPAVQQTQTVASLTQ